VVLDYYTFSAVTVDLGALPESTARKLSTPHRGHIGKAARLLFDHNQLRLWLLPRSILLGLGQFQVPRHHQLTNPHRRHAQPKLR